MCSRLVGRKVAFNRSCSSTSFFISGSTFFRKELMVVKLCFSVSGNLPGISLKNNLANFYSGNCELIKLMQYHPQLTSCESSFCIAYGIVDTLLYGLIFSTKSSPRNICGRSQESNSSNPCFTFFRQNQWDPGSRGVSTSIIMKSFTFVRDLGNARSFG